MAEEMCEPEDPPMTADTAPAADVQLKAKIFISYSRKDMAFADRLEAALKARGFEPLIDRTEIYAFEDWWKRLQALIMRADTVVFVLSPDSVASREALKEVEYAASLNKRFAPIVCRRVEDSATPEALRRLNFVFFDDPTQFEASADRLAEALQTDIGWIRQHTEFGEAARRWSAAGRPGGLLLRSPILEEAERWIASRPTNAPAPTEETQAFVAESRRGATRRRNILTGSLAAGLLVALVLAGLAYWQRGIAVAQRDRADQTLAAATRTAHSLVFDLAQRFRDAPGIPASLVKDILDRASALEDQLTASGQTTPELRRNQAVGFIEIADTLLTIGNATGAFEAAKHARQIVEALLPTEPDNVRWLQTLANSYERMGFALKAQGKSEEALKNYREYLATSQHIVALDGGDMRWQEGLAMAQSDIGQVLQAEGKLSEALKAYRESFAIMERLVASDHTNTRWQFDLSDSYDYLGTMLARQGKPDEALKSHRASLAIRESLIAVDPSNTRWQRGIYLSQWWIGDIESKQKNFDPAIADFRRGLEVMERLLVKNDPNNALWQRDVGSAYVKIGDILIQQGNLDEALGAYRDSLAKRERLAATDRSNTDWQFDLGISHERIGDVLKAQGDFDAALKEYKAKQDIITRLARLDPTNRNWQRDLAISFGQLALVYQQQGNVAEALIEFQKGREIITRLVEIAPDDAIGKDDLAKFDGLIAGLEGRKQEEEKN
jgi:tetratricopeptide (TPR) repeat protein